MATSQEGPPKNIRPDSFSTRTVVRPGGQIRQDLADLPQALREEANATLPLLNSHRVRRVIIALRTPETKGALIMQLGNHGEITIAVTGDLREMLSEKQFTGDAKGAEWDGDFFRQAHPDDPPYVQDGAIVKKGEMIGWAFIAKNNDGPVRAPAAGKIQFVVENGAKVKKRTTPDDQPDDATVIYYIDPNAK